jgi:dTDP-4-amino-4,6-dideoxygalactose transaminase
MSYNSWPSGKLPEDWQRPEPEIIKEQGYDWKDPRDIIEIFENKLAEFAGSKYAVVTDTCSHALFLSLQYRIFSKELKIGQEVAIPCNTYVSVPMQIIHSGLRPVFKKIYWTGLYELINTNIFDSAARFVKDMYVGEDSLQTLSFQIKKRLPIGKGGAILTNSLEAYDWLKLASYDGRDLKTDYTSQHHMKMIGWHYYMTPEDAARGIILFDKLPVNDKDSMDSDHYPDLSKISVFNEFVNKEMNV